MQNITLKFANIISAAQYSLSLELRLQGEKTDEEIKEIKKNSEKYEDTILDTISNNKISTEALVNDSTSFELIISELHKQHEELPSVSIVLTYKVKNAKPIVKEFY